MRSTKPDDAQGAESPPASTRSQEIAYREWTAEVLRRRAEVRPQMVRGILAQPEFDAVASPGTYGQARDQGADALVRLTAQQSRPAWWVANGRRGRTPAEAAGSAAPKEEDLPALIGTPKQVTWATSLRSQHLAAHPDSPHASQTASTWWIENRQKL